MKQEFPKVLGLGSNGHLVISSSSCFNLPFSSKASGLNPSVCLRDCSSFWAEYWGGGGEKKMLLWFLCCSQLHQYTFFQQTRVKLISQQKKGATNQRQDRDQKRVVELTARDGGDGQEPTWFSKGKLLLAMVAVWTSMAIGHPISSESINAVNSNQQKLSIQSLSHHPRIYS